MRRLPLLVLATMCLLPALPASAQDAASVNETLTTVFGESEKFEAAFAELQAAVAAGDAEAVADLAVYPLIVEVGERREIESAEDFVAEYDHIVTEPVARLITGQAYGDLIANFEGIAFGSGEVWLSGVCDDDACNSWQVKIITIQTGVE